MSSGIALQADLFTLDIPLDHVGLLGIHLSLLLTQNALSLPPSSLSLGDAFLLPAIRHTSSNWQLLTTCVVRFWYKLLPAVLAC